MSDTVKQPAHYLLPDGTEVKDHINSIVGGMPGHEAWKVANVIKYVSRADKKNGTEDLLKAREYLDMLIEDKGTNYIKELSSVVGSIITNAGTTI